MKMEYNGYEIEFKPSATPGWVDFEVYVPAKPGAVNHTRAYVGGGSRYGAKSAYRAGIKRVDKLIRANTEKKALDNEIRELIEKDRNSNG